MTLPEPTEEEFPENKGDEDVTHNLGRFQRVLPGSPERCKANNKLGQCQFRKQPGSEYCISHTSTQNIIRKTFHYFRILTHQQRIDEFAESKQLNTLKGEIAILRLTLEQVLNQCGNPNLFLAYSDKIIQLVTATNKALATSQSLAEKTGLVLGKDKILLIGDRIVSIMAEHITDTDVLEKIATDIGKMFDELQ